MRTAARPPEIDPIRPPRGGSDVLAVRRPRANGVARAALGLALAALVAHPAAAQKAKPSVPPESASWYAQTVARGDSELTVTYLWSLYSKLRAETVARGHKLVTIVNGDTYYVYDGLTMEGIAIQRSPAAVAADSPNLRPFGNEAQTLIDQGGEKVREENIAGMRADVYQITDDSGRRVVYVTQDDRRLPIRLELFDRKSSSTRYKEYIDWANDLPVTDAFFQPEPGILLDHYTLEEFIEYARGSDPAKMLPIVYPELLHGPAHH